MICEPKTSPRLRSVVALASVLEGPLEAPSLPELGGEDCEAIRQVFAGAVAKPHLDGLEVVKLLLVYRVEGAPEDLAVDVDMQKSCVLEQPLLRAGHGGGRGLDVGAELQLACMLEQQLLHVVHFRDVVKLGRAGLGPGREPWSITRRRRAARLAPAVRRGRPRQVAAEEHLLVILVALEALVVRPLNGVLEQPVLLGGHGVLLPGLGQALAERLLERLVAGRVEDLVVPYALVDRALELLLLALLLHPALLLQLLGLLEGLPQLVVGLLVRGAGAALAELVLQLLGLLEGLLQLVVLLAGARRVLLQALRERRGDGLLVEGLPPLPRLLLPPRGGEDLLEHGLFVAARRLLHAGLLVRVVRPGRLLVARRLLRAGLARQPVRAVRGPVLGQRQRQLVHRLRDVAVVRAQRLHGGLPVEAHIDQHVAGLVVVRATRRRWRRELVPVLLLLLH
mmetsp:Transcript_118578/g.336169  ORF Transcript_118578/g.336169 Transcript_118578/m.336169 type:complete len:452 (+) Transcript_118578:59-1414(+)